MKQDREQREAALRRSEEFKPGGDDPLRRFLERSWETLPKNVTRPSREEEDEILGYGPNGY